MTVGAQYSVKFSRDARGRPGTLPAIRNGEALEGKCCTASPHQAIDRKPMNLPANILPQPWYWLGLTGFAAVLAWTVRTAPWGRLRDSSMLNAWLGTIVILCTLWTIRAGIRPGLGFHLLGATACMLMFGPRLALLALSLVVVGAAAAGTLDWWAVPVNVLVMAAVPVAVSTAALRAVERWLPHHFFVYLFGNAFFGAALAMLATGLATSTILGASGAYSFDYLRSDYLPGFLLMAWAEAFTTGAAITLLVVYQPSWVATFDDARYLAGK